MKFLKYILFFVLNLLILSCGSGSSNTPPPSTSSVQSSINNLVILNLSGSFTTMGYQYGQAEQANLNSYYKALLSSGAVDFNDLSTQILMAAFYSETSPQFKDFLNGVAAGSNIPFLNILEIAAGNYLSFLGGCSAIMTDRTLNQNGHNAIIRNYDPTIVMWQVQNAFPLIVTIMHPTESGFNQLVSISSILMLPAATVINNQGILAEINNGMSSAPGIDPKNLYNGMVVTQAALNLGTESGFQNYLLTNLPSTSMIVGIAGPNSISYVEAATSKAMLGTNIPSESMIIYTNLFHDQVVENQKSYTLESDTTSQAVLRYNNLVNLAENEINQTGSFSENSLKNIITTPISAGGAFENSTTTSNIDRTLYSVYYDPVTEKLSIYYAGGNSQSVGIWTDLDLTQYFN